MKFITCLLLTIAFCGTASAGDHWDDCSSADGNVRLSNGILTVGDPQEVIEYSGEAKVLNTVKNEKTTCVLKDSGEIATVYLNVITVEEITYALEKTGPASTITETLICQRGAGNLVSAEFCQE